MDKNVVLTDFGRMYVEMFMDKEQELPDVVYGTQIEDFDSTGTARVVLPVTWSDALKEKFYDWPLSKSAFTVIEE